MEDTADAAYSGPLVTSQDSVFLRFLTAPPQKANPDDETPENSVFMVMIADTDRPDTIQLERFTEPPYPGYQFLDTVGFQGVSVFPDSCSTPCIYCPPCCIGMTGNVNMDPEDEVNLSDLTVLTNHLFVTFEDLPCEEEANTDGSPDGVINLSDLTRLANFLFVTFEPLADCLSKSTAKEGGTK